MGISLKEYVEQLEKSLENGKFFYLTPYGNTATLDDYFTAEELRKIADALDKIDEFRKKWSEDDGL
jgi:hypothetical protein